MEKSKSVTSLSVLKQSLEIINTDLQDLYGKRQKLSYMDEYREELDTKRKLSLRVNDLQEKMELIEFEINNMEHSIADLSKEKREIDFSTLQALYSEAQSFIHDLHVKFEELVAFHNSMIQNRIDFIKEQIESKHELLEVYSYQLSEILQ